MSEPEHMTVYSAGWLAEGTAPVLPALSQRAIAREDAAAAREAAEAAAAAEDRAEGAMLAARQRGIDTSLQGALDRALRASKADDYRAGRAELARSVADGEVEDLSGAARPAVRSADIDYEVDRLLERVADDRTWIIQFEQRMASRRGQGAEHIEGKRAEAEARRSRTAPVQSGVPGPSGPEISRSVEDAFVSIR